MVDMPYKPNQTKPKPITTPALEVYKNPTVDTKF